MERVKKNATPIYSLAHILFWITNCSMFSFSATYLLDKGYTNGHVGLVLAFSYGISALMQPAMAAFFQKKGIRVNAGMACMYAFACLLVVCMLALPLGKGLLAVTFVVVLTLQNTMQPALNSLAKDIERGGRDVNFGLARGIGSAAFSITSALTGLLMRRFTPGVVPVVYLCSMAALAAVLLALQVPAPLRVDRAGGNSGGNFLREHPRFVLFLLGAVGIFTTHMFIENFMIQIMYSLGGDSSNQGVAIAIAGIVELPAMMLYSRISRRFGGNNVLVAVGWIWMVKNLLVVFAGSPAAIYVSELLQFGAFALYVPAMVEYVGNALPPQDFLKGQALAGSAFTVGCLVASSLGGVLIDIVGIRMALILSQLFSVAGTVLFTIAIPHGKKEMKR